MNNLAFKIPAELERTEAVAKVRPERTGVLRNVAKSLSKRGVLEAKVELCNEALLSLVDVLFDVDGDGVFANIDRDGRIMVPLPWGSAGYKVWGLRQSEARALSLIMQSRSEADGALFVWVPDSRLWVVGSGYTKRTATAYLRTMPITLSDFRVAYDAVRSVWARKNLDK